MSDDLISRKALLDKLALFSDRVNGNEHFLFGIETAKEIVEDMPGAFGGWIPVEEATPEPRVDVLADFGGDTPIIAWHSNVSGWKNSSTDMEVSRRVIAWRPLPEPYQAERRT